MTLSDYGLVYVATPYTKYHGGIEEAFITAAKVSAMLVKRGVRLFSPICHCHPIAVYGKIDPRNHDIWLNLDRAMMDRCDALAVIKMDGWRESRGISVEVATFISAKKPIFYLDYESIMVEP